MKKVLTIIVSAIGFGLIAGLVMIGVNYVSKDVSMLSADKNETAVESESTNETEAQKVIEKVYVENDLYTNAIENLVDETMPSVVSITNMIKYKQNGFSMYGFRRQAKEYEAPASGTGVIVLLNDEEVIMLTNHHVIQDSSSLSVTFMDNETVDAAIKGSDSNKDLAIISVKKDKLKKETLDILKAAKLGDSSKIKVGQQVVAIGNALGEGLSATTGIVSAKEKTIDGNSEKLIQTDAAINPGNSGGPLFNMNKELVGINVAKSAGQAVEGVGYAIPVNSALDVIDTLSTKKDREAIPEEEQGYLGVLVKNVDAQYSELFDMPEGIYVYQIQEDGAAAKSELKPKDIIVEFDDQKVKTNTELSELISYTKAGQEVNIKVKRLENGDYVDKTFKITMGNRPKNETKEEETKKSEKKQEDDGYYYYDPFEDFFNDNFFRGFGGMW